MSFEGVLGFDSLNSFLKRHFGFGDTDSVER